MPGSPSIGLFGVSARGAHAIAAVARDILCFVRPCVSVLDVMCVPTTVWATCLLFLTRYCRYCVCRGVRRVVVARCRKGGCDDGIYFRRVWTAVSGVQNDNFLQRGVCYRDGMWSRVSELQSSTMRLVYAARWRGRSKGRENKATPGRRGIVWPRSRHTLS